MNGRLRLLHLRDQNEAFSDRLNSERARFSNIAGSTPTVAVSSFNLFQTPEAIADRMASMIPPGVTSILEPSAGLGRLYLASVALHPCPHHLIDVSRDCCDYLFGIAREYDRVRCADFMETDLPGFGAVVMNPPFKQGTDIRHILRARSLLKPGGLLVSLCFDGVRQNAKLRPVCDTWEVLPPDSFKSEGTRSGVVLLTMRA